MISGIVPLLNVAGDSKSAEFNIQDIQSLCTSKNDSWFKGVHVKIDKSTNKSTGKKWRQTLWCYQNGWPGLEAHAQRR